MLMKESTYKAVLAGAKERESNLIGKFMRHRTWAIIRGRIACIKGSEAYLDNPFYPGPYPLDSLIEVQWFN